MTTTEWNCGDPNERIRYAARTSAALRCLEGKWKIVVLSELFGNGTLRFSDIERAVPGVTQKVLIRQLKELEQDGLVLRTAYPVVPPKVEYSLTPSAHALAPAIAELMKWAAVHRPPPTEPVDNPSCKD